MQAAVRRLTPTLLVGPTAVVAAAFVDSPYRELLWVVGAAIDFGGPAIKGMGGFRVPPSFFVGRHGSILIIALGEAIVRVGAGAGQDLAQPAVLVAVALGVIVSACLWASYFGQAAGAQARLSRAQGLERAQLARDAYSYLHLPLVGGIVLFALGVQVAISEIGAELEFVPALALCGGVALFFGGDVAYRWRDHEVVFSDRLVAAIAAVAVVPLAMNAPALVALLTLAVIGIVRTRWEERGARRVST